MANIAGFGSYAPPTYYGRRAHERGFEAKSGDAADTTPPTVTIVSPTPGVAPGAPGGFPADYNAAKLTPITLTVTDVEPGVALILLTVRLGTNKRHLIYDGNFNDGFTSSSVTPIVNGFQFTILPDGGWPGVTSLIFEAKPIDLAGNLTP